MKRKAKFKYPGLKFAGVWLPEDLHKKLKEIASSDDRSISVFMRRLIEREVNNHESGS